MSDTTTDRLTLRHWPTLLSFAGVALLCFGGLVPMARTMFPMASGDRPERLLLAAALFLAVLVLGVCATVKLRSRLILDDDGVTSVSTFSRHRLTWSQITDWEVESGPRRWLIRAWCDDRPHVVFRLLMPGSFGNSTVTDETYPEPPLPAPGGVHKTFDELIAHWRASGSNT
ncbi:MAG: PH domain-containing protein [Stackebrandtia sp.]